MTGGQTDRPTAGRPVPTIGVNLTWLVPGVVGGSEEYIVRLLEGVVPLAGDRFRLRLYTRPEFAAAHPALVERYQVVTAPDVASKPARIALENTWLASVSRGDDFVHHPGGTVPYVRAQPAVVTVHDLQPLEMPEHFHPMKRIWLGRGLPYGTRVARLVLCPSRFTAARLHALLQVPEAKIRVVPHGHRPPAADPTVAGLSAGQDDCQDEHTDRLGRFLLYPTIAYPHKRHIDLVRALPRLDDRFRDVGVVFTGRPGPELENVLAEATSLGVGDRVHSLGRVPAAELDRLYRAAAAMVFPSSYEGFGNPVVEAMGVGCPVVVSDAGALPEVVGDAGLTFPVGDVGALVEAVTKLLDNPALAETMSRLGLDQARSFDLGIAAGRLADVYCELVDSAQH